MAHTRHGARRGPALPLALLVALAAALLQGAAPTSAGVAPFVVTTVGNSAYNVSYASTSFNAAFAQLTRHVRARRGLCPAWQRQF